MAFYVNLIDINATIVLNNYYFELQSDNFPFLNGFDTQNSKYKTIATNLCNQGNKLIYKVANFNGQYINFKIYDTLPSSLYIGSWLVILKLTGIEE